ncbi:MAG: polysaccharide deacetylase family protein [Chloroflexota bacterium]
MSFINSPILAYHQIIPVGSLKNADPLAVSADQFERQMNYLYHHSYRCLSLLELLSPSAGQTFHPDKTFVLTFDDGYENFLTQAFPILQRYGFTATVFLVTDLVGAASDWAGEQGNPLLSWAQVKTLQRAGVSFGSHTHTHPVLPRLAGKQIYFELATSRACLEAQLEQEILLLAYPYGESDAQVQSIARAVGYQAACGVATGRAGRFNLLRRQCQRDDALQTFIYRLSRPYSYWYGLRKWLREETKVGRFLRQIKRRRFAKMGKVSRETSLPDLISNKGVEQ